MSGSVLVAGIGNVFLADDGFGVEVVRRLSGERLPPGVQVEDFGIRGLHLALRLLDGVDLLVLVDAVARGAAPGTLFLLDPEGPVATAPAVDAHGMDPASVLASVQALGGAPIRTLVVGCQPLELCERVGLSEPVARSVEEAVRVVQRLVTDAISGVGDSRGALHA